MFLTTDTCDIVWVDTPIPTKADHTTRMVIISESGLYKLIMRSDKPEARAFQNWVTQVVLPSIRKDGGYVAGEDGTGAPDSQ